MPLATSRRLRDELNVDTALEYVYKFSYQEKFGDLGSEHELCHVYLGRIDAPVTANEHEVEALRYVSADTLAQELEHAPEQFTPWFRMEWLRLMHDYRGVLSRYTTLLRA